MALSLAALLSAVEVYALILIPLGLLLIGLPEERRTRWTIIGASLVFVGMIPSGSLLSVVSRGWALVVGAAFLATTLVRPRWDVTSRALVAIAAALLLGGAVLLASGRSGEFSGILQEHFAAVAATSADGMQRLLPSAPPVEEFTVASVQVASMYSDLFVALLALQTLAALALGSWWVRRLGRSGSDAFVLNRMRDFRFNDQLIWLLIGALLVVILPVGEWLTGAAWNVVAFMAVLYAVRGLAIFVFLATGSRSVPTMVLGTIAFIFLFQVAITAALLMGVGDTWLDVRRRLVAANPA